MSQPAKDTMNGLSESGLELVDPHLIDAWDVPCMSMEWRSGVRHKLSLPFDFKFKIWADPDAESGRLLSGRLEVDGEGHFDPKTKYYSEEGVIRDGIKNVDSIISEDAFGRLDFDSIGGPAGPAKVRQYLDGMFAMMRIYPRHNLIFLTHEARYRQQMPEIWEKAAEVGAGICFPLGREGTY